MKLLTKAIERKLPKLYATEDIKIHKKVAQVKYFNPVGNSTWYGIEYDPVSKVFFGYYSDNSNNSGLGYFSLQELETLKLPYGLSIERDMHFIPDELGNIINL